MRAGLLTIELLKQVETAVEERIVDKVLLTRVAGSRIAVAVVKRLLRYARSRSGEVLGKRIRTHYSGHTFEAYARLDVPTFDNPIIQRQLDEIAGGRTSVAWESLKMLMDLASNVVLLASQMSVLGAVLREQRDGVSIALLSVFPELLRYMRIQKFLNIGGMFYYSPYLCQPS